MNKSKFLKKSLAVLLAVLMATAMIPLSAAADALSPSLNGAYVKTDGGLQSNLKIDTTAKTITGNIPTSATTIDLYVLVEENTTGTAKVDYFDKKESDKPTKPMTADGALWHTGNITFSKNDFQAADGTINMEIYVQYDNDSASSVTYQVTLTPKTLPSDATIKNMRVWTSQSTSTGGPGVKGIPQLGNTVIDQVNKVIDITVPYGTESVWLRDIEMVEGAWAASATTVLENEIRFIKNFSAASDGDIGDNSVVAAHGTDGNSNTLPYVVTLPVKVNAGTHNNTYTLRLTWGSGFESFTMKDAIDSRVFPGEGKIVVVMPFGYTSDNNNDEDKSKTITDGDTLTLVPEFNLQYSGTEQPNLSWTNALGNVAKVKSGESKIKVAVQTATGTVNIDTSNYDYSDPTKRLQNAVSYAKWINDNGITAADVEQQKFTVEYVEGTDRDYDLIVVEPDENYESKITEFDVGTETATIDQDAKTINIKLPKGADKSRIPVNTIKIEASDRVAITLPLQDGVKFTERAQSDTPAGHIKDTSGGAEAAYAHKENLRSVTEQFVKAVEADETLNGITIKKNVVTNSGNNNSAHTLDATSQVIIRVTSHDGTSISDYKLNVEVEEQYVKPAITSLTLQSADGKLTRTGKLDPTTGIFTFEVPYKYKTTEDLKDFKVFYQKTVGSEIVAYENTNTTKVENAKGAWGKVTGFTLDGTEAFLHSYNTNTASRYGTIESNSKDTSTKGSKIVASTKNPLTNEAEEAAFYILLVRETPSTNSALKSFALTSTGTLSTVGGTQRGTPMSIDDVNNENRYDGRIVSADKKVTVNIPWSHYIQNGQGGAGAETHILDAMHMIAETADENATVWFATDRWASPVDSTIQRYMFIPSDATKKDIAGIDIADLINNSHTLEIYVLSEQLSVDLLSYTTRPTWGEYIKISDVEGAANANKLYTKYTLEVKQADPQTSHNLNSIKLKNYDAKYGVREVTLQKNGNTLSGVIPYSMMGENLYLDYDVSPRAMVLGGELPGSGGAFTTVEKWTDAGAKDDDWNINNTDKRYLKSDVGHFDDWGVNYNDKTHANTSTLLPNGGAFLKIVDTKGTVEMYANAGVSAVANVDKLVVASEAGTSGADVYTLKIDVANVKNENLITSFKVDGQVGAATINNDTDTINVTVSSTVERTALKTEWTLSDGAYMESLDASGKHYNYTTERLFTVVAENGTSKRTYRVNVTVQEGFVDVLKGSWYYDDVMTAFRNGWVSGVGEGKFNPGGNLTRGQFAMLIAGVENYDSSKYTEKVFPDVDPTDYYGPAVAYCVEKGYISGFNDGTFKPKNNITREQAAVVMCAAADLNPTEGKTVFADDAQIGGWAKKFINACYEAGIYKGVENNNFAPKRNVTRAQGASLVVRAFSK